MLIDWYTVGAQVLNFLVLMVLLKVFLFNRVVKAMDKREKSIQERLDEGRGKMEEARRMRRECEAQMAELDQHRKQVLAEAKEEARKAREDIMAKAREEVRLLAESWKDGVRREREAFLAHLSQMAGNQILELSRKILADLADAELEGLAARKFMDLLDAMNQTDREDLARAMQNAGGQVVVKTAWELSKDLKRAFSDKLGQLAAAEIEFRVSEELTLGVLLLAGGRTFGFNVPDYLDDLHEAMGQILDMGVDRREGQDTGGADHA